MAINTPPVPDARLNMKIRSLFLDHLAHKANVAAAKPAQPDLATLKAQLILKLTRMRQRAEESAAARAEPEPKRDIEGDQNADA